MKTNTTAITCTHHKTPPTAAQGAGGMVLVDPLFQRVVVRECRRRGIPVIFDEVRPCVRVWVARACARVCEGYVRVCSRVGRVWRRGCGLPGGERGCGTLPGRLPVPLTAL